VNTLVRARRHIGTGTFRATEKTHELVRQVLESGHISYGPMSMDFERQIAELHGCHFGVLANSGTSALQVALQALKELQGWEDGDEVLVPAVTFVATANIVLHNRMKPVFVDIDDYYGMDPFGVEALLPDHPKARAILPVHLFGQAADMTDLLYLARLYGLMTIEDCCEAMFASHYGAVVGSWGEVGCFSTYNAHLITTGVGGMATTNDPELAKRMRCLVNHGLDPDELNMDENFSPRPVIGRSFRFAFSGHSYRITELEAALGLAQLEDWRTMVNVRRRNANHLRARLSIANEHADADLTLPKERPGNSHSWMMFPIVCGRPEKGRLTAWLNERDIETRDMLPLTNQPVFREFVFEEDYPHAQVVNERGFYVGVHQDLGPDDIDYMADCFEDYFRSGR
jgi:perosamine synthetase